MAYLSISDEFNKLGGVCHESGSVTTESNRAAHSCWYLNANCTLLLFVEFKASGRASSVTHERAWGVLVNDKYQAKRVAVP